jgi:prefoldin subunit 5
MNKKERKEYKKLEKELAKLDKEIDALYTRHLQVIRRMHELKPVKIHAPPPTSSLVL